LRDYRQTDGELGYFQHTFRVYDREGQPCLKPGCGGTIARVVQSGRSSFYCPRCQR
jgi:formamidopyrimidine-DNA glycosylase